MTVAQLRDRTRARGIALQCLYEADQSTHPINVIMQERMRSIDNLDEEQWEFAAKIVTGVRPYIKKIDQCIADYAPEWPVDQIAVIDRNIIRIALWECLIDDITPIKVAINESVELAKTFGSDSSQRFVNGVLGSLVSHEKEVRAVLFS